MSVQMRAAPGARMKDPAEDLFPGLREDLDIFRSGTGCILQDGLSGKNFRIGKEAFAILCCLDSGSFERIAIRAGNLCGTAVTTNDVASLANFLSTHGLVDSRRTGDPPAKPSGLMGRLPILRLLSSLSFIRVPLFCPEPFLKLAWPVVGPIFTRAGLCSILLAGLCGTYLASRQWDVFSTTFMSFLSFEGALVFTAGIALLMLCHEMGHAFMAHKFGVRVPVIGLAFMYFVPVLYTDTTDAWRLQDERSRRLIDAGGIIADLSVAALATLTWSFLEDGSFRSLVFSLATISWIASLAVNLNPLMRFDGYYLFSSLVGVENLHPRGFALARWHLRECLFALGDQPPERLPAMHHAILLAHAYASWIYRLLLALAIATAAWHLVSKVVGMALFIGYLAMMVAQPVANELAAWRKRIGDIRASGRSRYTGLALLGLILFSLIPLPHWVAIPVVAGHEHETVLHAPASGFLQQLHLVSGQTFHSGDVMAVIKSPEIESGMDLARLRIQLLETRIRRITADASDRSLVTVLGNELETERRSLKNYEDLLADMVLRAPFDGRVGYVDPELTHAMWINTEAPLAYLHSEDGGRLRGMVSEADILQLGPGFNGRFIPDDPLLPSCQVVLERLAPMPAAGFAQPELADSEDSIVPVEQPGIADDTVVPHGNWYEAGLVPPGHDCPDTSIASKRGIVRIHAGYSSILSAVFKRIARVVIRESGF
ncbi:MAG: hypothetical protein R3D32_06960 [Nitratireductor sp.]